MKQKLKKLKLLLTISLAGLLLNSCQEEFDESYSESKNHNLVKEYTFKQASQKPKFNNAYHKFANGLDQMKRTNKSMDSDFVIDSTLVKEVTLNNQTTYTMAIKRAIPNDSYFENLIVQVKNGDSTRAYIAKYTPTKEMVYYQEHNSYTFEAASEIKEIVFDTSGFQNKITLVCFSVMVCHWGGTVHIAGEHCSNISDGTGCFEVSSGDSSGLGDGSDGLSSPGGGSSSSSSGGGIPTAPVPPAPKPPKPPCEKLKNTLNPSAANFKPTLDNLHTTITPTSTGEDGAVFNKNPLGNYLPAQNIPSTNSNSIDATLTADTFCWVHTHPLDCYPMFSWSDVNTLLTLVGTASAANVPEVTIMLVVKDDAGVNQVYALTINDVLNFSIKVDNAINSLQMPMFVTEEARLYELDKIMQDKYDNDSNYERAFLEIFEGFGITLLKANSSLTGWEQLEITNPDTTPSTVNKIPCN